MSEASVAELVALAELTKLAALAEMSELAALAEAVSAAAETPLNKKTAVRIASNLNMTELPVDR